MIATPAMADLYNVAATTYVQGAFNTLDSKLNVASAGNYISAGTDVKSNLGALDTQVKANADAIAGKATAATTLAGYGITNAYTKTEVDTALAAKQNKLQNNAATPADISATVKTTVAAAANASDTSLVTEKAVATAIESATTGAVTLNGTQTLTNKTIDADNNTISNLEADNFKSGTIVNSTTGIAAYASASDSKLVTEKAAAKAVTVTETGDQYGAITAVANANGGIQVTRGATQVQVKSNNTVTGAATIWIE